MRFFVHVTPIGKVDTQSYCVEADSWQKALQNARALRKEDAPITGFSIELTDDGGCRAVDPAARLRYVVKRAPDTAVLTEGGSGPRTTDPQLSARNSAPSRTIGFGTGTVAVRNSSEAQVQALSSAASEHAPTSDPHVLYRREQEPTDESPLLYREDVYVMAEGTSEAQAEKYLRAQFLTIKAVLASGKTGKYVNLAVFDRAFEGRPTVPPIATLSWKDWKGQEPTVLYPRRGGATPGTRAAAGAAQNNRDSAASPQAEAPRSSAISAVTVPLPEPMDRVSAAQAVAATYGAASRQSDSGVLVAPVVNVHPGAALEPPPAIAALGEALRRASQPPPGPSPALVPTSAPAQPALRASASTPGQPALRASSPGAATLQGGGLAEVPAAFPSPNVLTPTPMPVPAELLTTPSDPAVRLSRTSSRPSRPSWAGARARVRGDELIAVLFEAMHDLHFSRDALEGSEFCLQLALENIPSRAAFAHFYDIDKREYVIVATVGAGTQQLILRHHPPTDPLLSAAMRKRTAIVLSDAAKNDDAFVERFEVLGGAKSVIVAPVMLGGRALAAIELVNPTDGVPYSEAEGNAMTYMGEQFAEYVSSHGLVLDPARIRNRRNPS